MTKIFLAIFLFMFLIINDIVFADDLKQNQKIVINDFQEALNLLKSTKHDFSKDEDLTSPFVEAHFVEQRTYASLYEEQYEKRAQGSTLNWGVIKVESTAPLPKKRDVSGHLLWYSSSDLPQLSSLVNTIFSRGQFDKLDFLFNDWSDGAEKMSDGNWMLPAFEGVVAPSILGEDRSIIYKGIQAWRAKSPKSPAAALAEVLWWEQYAWDARGHGYANSVSPEGWALFRERLERAEAVLEESKPYAQSNPYWGERLISVGVSLGWPKDRLLAAFRAQPNKTMETYNTMAMSLLPKWGGSWDLVEAFARDVADQTRQTEGYSMYSRIYSSVAMQESGRDSNIFLYSLANWSDVKRGFEDMMRIYPHSARNLNRFAAFACMADDKTTFLNTRFRIGKTIVPNRWPMNYSLDLCEHKFPLQPL